MFAFVYNGIMTSRVDSIVYTGTKVIIGESADKDWIKCQEISCAS